MKEDRQERLVRQLKREQEKLNTLAEKLLESGYTLSEPVLLEQSNVVHELLEVLPQQRRKAAAAPRKRQRKSRKTSRQRAAGGKTGKKAARAAFLLDFCKSGQKTADPFGGVNIV